MTKLFLIITIIISFQFYSCNEKPRQIKIIENKKIFLIFNKKDTYKFDTINLVRSGKLYNSGPQRIYTEFQQAKTNIIASNNDEIDTIIICPKSNSILLEENYHGYYSKFCLLSIGDSVVVNYIEGKPYFKFLNKKSYSFDNTFDEKFNSNEPLPITIAYFKYNTIWSAQKISSFVKTSIDYYSRLNIKLDSLYNNKLVSSCFFYFRKNYNNYLLSTYSGKPTFDFKAMSKSSQDSMMLYNFFRLALQDFVNSKLSKAKQIKTLNGSFTDFRTVYDSVRNSNILSSTAKNYLLFSDIQLIAQNFSERDFVDYFKKFENDIHDTTMISEIKNQYFLNFSKLKEESRELNLIDLNKNEISLDGFLKKNKGKIVYVDFWASWCEPCRRLMPIGKILRQEYQSKDVVFVYISIDKEFDAWKNASEKEKLNYYPNNFLSLNTDIAKIFKELNISTIPRYLLFNKMGNLIHKNAPDPSSQEIRELFNKIK